MEKEGAYILLAILWIAYYGMHSILASMRAKRFVASRFPKIWRYYRVAYNVIAVLGAGVIFMYQWSLPTVMQMPTKAWMLCLGAIIIFIGLFIGGAAFLSFDKSEFFGLKQLEGKPEKKGKLLTSGLYSMVRHPLYFALILIISGYLLYSFHLSNLIFAICTFTYLLIGTKLEEAKLVETFGRDYLAYRHKVKMLIPFLF